MIICLQHGATAHPRRIGIGCEIRVFKPAGTPLHGLGVVRLDLDGLEAMRLANLDGLYQEVAAEQMGVSSARRSAASSPRRGRGSRRRSSRGRHYASAAGAWSRARPKRCRARSTGEGGAAAAAAAAGAGGQV